MGTTTKIAWCHHTFNPWRGCAKVSPGCANCYAERGAKRNPAVLGTWGPDGARVVASEAYWRQPLAWDRAAAKAGERRRVFCASLADVFEDRPDLVVPRLRLFETIYTTPHLDWLLLTKRPEDIRRIAPLSFDMPLPNVWWGTTCEDQTRADERIPHLLAVPAAVRFLSVEPMLGPVDLGYRGAGALLVDGGGQRMAPSSLAPAQVDWVIVGGESGPNARPCDVAWIRDVVRQCREAGVPCFVKQLGTRPWDSAHPEYDDDAQARRAPFVAIDEVRCVAGIGLRDPKGGDPGEWPEDLRVREIPKVEGTR